MDYQACLIAAGLIPQPDETAPITMYGVIEYLEHYAPGILVRNEDCEGECNAPFVGRGFNYTTVDGRYSVSVQWINDGYCEHHNRARDYKNAEPADSIDCAVLLTDTMTGEWIELSRFETQATWQSPQQVIKLLNDCENNRVVPRSYNDIGGQ